MVETLRRSITEAEHRGRIQGIMPTPNFLAFTHNQFINDIILAREVKIMEAKNFKGIQEDYEKAFGKKVNYEKTIIYFLNTPVDRQNFIAQIFQCQIE